jgi:serine/threonine protein kinase
MDPVPYASLCRIHPDHPTSEEARGALKTMVNARSNSGLATHLIRWRQVNVWDYYVEKYLIGEGSIGNVSLVQRRKGTEGGSAYTKQRAKEQNCVSVGCRGFFGCFLPKRKPTRIEKTTSGIANPSHHSEYYALKSIHLRVVERKYLEELRNEIDILRALDHPNIVKAYEVYETKGNIYVVMEYCSGGDLYSRAPYTENESVPLISQICSAICFMHKNGVIHRDLKVEK